MAAKKKVKKSTRKSVKKKTVKKIQKTTKEKRSVKYPVRKLVDDKSIAMDFAAKVHKKFQNVIKATILFGSAATAKNVATASSDLDIIIVVDDAAINWDLELVAWYREELSKLISRQRYPRELHINTVKLTTFWNDLLHGDSVVINILRYGEALIDLGGFFNPLKALLLQGKIHSTPEAVYAALQRAPHHLARSEVAQLSAIEGVYWSMTDAAQATLITLGKLPPSPEHIAPMLMQYFVDSKMMKREYVEWYKEIFNLHKAIDHGRIRAIKGVEIDEWQDRASRFLQKSTEIIDQLLESKK